LKDLKKVFRFISRISLGKIQSLETL